MTVQELIDLLQKVENKERPVVVFWDGTFDYVRTATELKLFTNQNSHELSIWRSTNPIEIDCVLIDPAVDAKNFMYCVSDSFETLKKIV